MFLVGIFLLTEVVLVSAQFSLAFSSHDDSERNPCLPNPCQNEGQCAVSGSSFDCSCSIGWKGERCEGRYDLSAVFLDKEHTFIFRQNQNFR